MDVQRSSVKVILLGSPYVKVDDQTPGFRIRKDAALLALLVCARRPLVREQVAALLWNTVPEEDARASLRRSLHNLSLLLPGCIDADRQSIAFAPPAASLIDLYRIDELDETDTLVPVEVYDLCRGSLLEGVLLDDATDFETWLLVERERWLQKCVRLLERLVTQQMAGGNAEAALRSCHRLVELAPWREEAQRTMMLLLARTGQLHAALKQYEVCAHLLEQELEVSPTTETERLRERIAAALHLPPHTIPPVERVLIGRARELREIRRYLLNPDCRLLTISGVGGIGKTHVALQAAREVNSATSRAFLHGVAFVSLLGVRRSDFIYALGSGVGITFSGQEPVEQQLLRYLADKEMLLVLDNYEHLLPDTDLLVKLLRQAPDVKVLVTSRERLHLRGEWLFEIDSLPYPPPANEADSDRNLYQYAAVQLFERCAQQVRRDFSVATALSDVARICQLVHGLPLALELAAAAMYTRTPEEVVSALSQGLDLLETRERDIDPRHRSIRATFLTTWERLTTVEQETMARLSVFAGGFTRAAALKVAGGTSATLDTLVNKSLLRRTLTGRYEFHELLRQFAAEAFSGMPHEPFRVQQRHSAYFAEWLAEREADMHGGAQRAGLNGIATEMENLRAAWSRAVTERDIPFFLRSHGGVGWYFVIRSGGAEGAAMMESALKRLATEDATEPHLALLLARLTMFLGYFLTIQSKPHNGYTLLLRARDHFGRVDAFPDSATAGLFLAEVCEELGKLDEFAHYLREGLQAAERTSVPMVESILRARLVRMMSHDDTAPQYPHCEQMLGQARERAEQRSNPFALAHVYYYAGWLEVLRENYTAALDQFVRCRAECSALQCSKLLAMACNAMSYCYQMVDDKDASLQVVQEGLDIARVNGLLAKEVYSLTQLGQISVEQGDLAAGERYYRDGIALDAMLGGTNFAIELRGSLGHLLLVRGRSQEAFPYLKVALSEAYANGRVSIACWTLIGIAKVVADAGDGVYGLTLFAVGVTHINADSRWQYTPGERKQEARILQGIHTSVAPEQYEAAWARGTLMSLEEAIGLAVALEPGE